MNKEKKMTLALGLMLLVLAYLWWKRRQAMMAPAEALGMMDPFAAPYYSTVPGIPDMTQLINGANNPFVSVINVNAQIDAYSGLNNNYIPLFGMVGVTGSGL